MFPKAPTKEQLQYFDQCLEQLYRIDGTGGFTCVVREHPLSLNKRSFYDVFSFGALQQAMNWVVANRRK